MLRDDHNDIAGNGSEGEKVIPGLPDDGLIHEWLDGELNAEDSARLEELVKSSKEFAARVAQARGEMAAASRILSALDDVPSGVIPPVSTEKVIPIQSAKKTSTISWKKWSSIAAVLMVGVTGILVTRDGDIQSITMAESSVQASSVEPIVPQSSNVQTSIESDPAPEIMERRAPEPPAQAQAPAPSPAPSPIADEISVAPLQSSPQKLNEAVQEAGIAVAKRSAASPAMARSLAAAPMMASDNADAYEAIEFSGIDQENLLLAAQRVSCRPTCIQLRFELSTNGTFRKWQQQSPAIGSGNPEIGNVSADSVSVITALIDSLDLKSMPEILRLDGSKCVSVGNLRESMRVEFRSGSSIRRIMALPWCSDGTHALDIVFRRLESLHGPSY